MMDMIPREIDLEGHPSYPAIDRQANSNSNKVHMKINRIIAFLIILFSTACGEVPNLENVDLEQWKEDKNACKEYRMEAIDNLLKQKGKLRGLSQNEIINLLGSADKHQLYERSQKFFIYYLEPSEKCDQYREGYIKALYIRFNSLDQAVDFNIQKVL